MDKISKIASKLFLFCGIDSPTVTELLSLCAPEIRHYMKGEVIYSPSHYKDNIGFVVDGKCEVRRCKSDSPALTLNVLERYDSFGVLAAFSSEEFPTEVYAAKECEILFISKSDVLLLIERNPQISKNIITFLANRISFLNKRIATFTCTKTEDRLVSYLLSEYKRLGSAEIPINCQKTATVINVGRASVYRALDALSSAGYITYDTKKIIIKKPIELERTLK